MCDLGVCDLLAGLNGGQRNDHDHHVHVRAHVDGGLLALGLHK